MMLERDHELMVAGVRPSTVREGESWLRKKTARSSRGTRNRGAPPDLPVARSADSLTFSRFPTRAKHTAVLTNIGPARAWRAPNHPQMCLITMSALDDLAAKLNMDSGGFLPEEHRGSTGDRSTNYTEELKKAAELMDWKKKWHPRGDDTVQVR